MRYNALKFSGSVLKIRITVSLTFSLHETTCEAISPGNMAGRRYSETRDDFTQYQTAEAIVEANVLKLFLLWLFSYRVNTATPWRDKKRIRIKSAAIPEDSSIMVKKNEHGNCLAFV